jgi:excisionase family DNA binding protein
MSRHTGRGGEGYQGDERPAVDQGIVSPERNPSVARTQEASTTAPRSPSGQESRLSLAEIQARNGHRKATSSRVDDPEFLSHQHFQRTRAGTIYPDASRLGGSGHPRRLLTLVEAADLLGVSVASVRRLIWRGDLPTVRLTRRVQVDGRDLERLIERAKARGGHE